MKTYKTKAFHINEAQRELEQDKEITRLEAINFITNPTNKEEYGTLAWNDKEKEIETELNPKVRGYCQIYNQESKQAFENIKKSGAYPYNSIVAKELLKILGLNPLENYIKRAEHIVYGTNRHFRHIKKMEMHENYLNNGYISIQDITEVDNGKKAFLSGKVEYDFLSSTKENEKVRLVCDKEHLGYQTKGQRRKYHIASTNDLYVKIIEA